MILLAVFLLCKEHTSITENQQQRAEKIIVSCYKLVNNGYTRLIFCHFYDTYTQSGNTVIDLYRIY